METLFDMADKLRELRDIKDEYKAALSAVNEEIDAIEKEMADAMIEEECSNFVRGDKMFVLTSNSFWSAADEQKDQLYQALQGNGYKHIFSVNSRTLHSTVRDIIDGTTDENGDTHIPKWLDGLIKSHDKTGITMRQATKKSKSKGALNNA